MLRLRQGYAGRGRRAEFVTLRRLAPAKTRDRMRRGAWHDGRVTEAERITFRDLAKDSSLNRERIGFARSEQKTARSSSNPGKGRSLSAHQRTFRQHSSGHALFRRGHALTGFLNSKPNG